MQLMLDTYGAGASSKSSRSASVKKHYELKNVHTVAVDPNELSKFGFKTSASLNSANNQPQLASSQAENGLDNSPSGSSADSANTDNESQSTLSVRNFPITSLEENEYTCEEVMFGLAEDRSIGKFDSKQHASFKYCTISWKIGCAQPPCIEEGDRNPRYGWPSL